MPHEVVWEDPPPPVQKRSWQEILAPLTECPERWARVADEGNAGRARGLAQNLRRGQIKVPDGRWEFVSRGRRVYARYLGS